jgi:hypothetical protein
MNSVQRILRVAVTAAMAVSLVAITAGAASAAGPNAKATYNSVPVNLPGNVPSQPFQAQQTSEFGDSVTLAAGGRNADSVDVVMSSWGCQSGTWNGGDCSTVKGATFSHPITLNLYNVGTNGEPDGAAFLTKTVTFAIPYRPSSDAVKCTGDNAGKWFNNADKTCYSGFATKISFKLDGTTLPTNLIWAVAYNTSGYGPAPLGYEAPCNTSVAGCPYDSLNVGVQSFGGQPSAGTDVDTNGAVINSATPGVYCDGGTGGVNTFRLDSPCWTGYRPLATIRTK